MRFEEQILDEITNQYGTMYHFEQKTGVYRATVIRIREKGIDSVSEKTKEALAYYLGLSYKGILEHKIIFEDVSIKPDWIAKKEAERSGTEYQEPYDGLLSEMLMRAKKLNSRGKFKVIEYINDIMKTYSEE